MKLISMVDFVLDRFCEHSLDNEYASYEFMVECNNYANFIKQPLTLGMFVPCDAGGNVLEEPKNYSSFLSHEDSEIVKDNPRKFPKSKQYQQAKERVLFEGFDTIHVGWLRGSVVGTERTIENLANERNKNLITLTPNAIKQIGL